jgi:mono/diheme cytochrome c family protein
MNGPLLRLMTRVAIGAMVVYAGAAAGLTQEREDRESGAYLYRVFCVVCHGDSGRGDGPVSDTLRRPVPDLTVLSRQAGEIGTQQGNRPEANAGAGGPCRVAAGQGMR